MQTPGNRVDYIRFTSYYWPPVLTRSTAEVANGWVNNYVDRRTTASFITYFGLTLLKR